MADATPDTPSTPPPRRRGRWRWLAAAPLLALGVGAWLLGTASGARTAAHLAAGFSHGALLIQVESGSLLGPLALERLEYHSAGQHIRAHTLTLDWSPTRLTDGLLAVRHLTTASLEITSAPSTGPTPAPTDLTLPLALTVERLEIGQLRLLATAAPPAEPVETLRLGELAARLDSDGRRHRLQALSLQHDLGQLMGEASLDGQAPFPLALHLRATGTAAGHDFALQAEASGTLLAPQLRAQAQGADLAGQAELALTPFAPVPFHEARLQLDRLNPAVFAPGAPQARLRINAELRPAGGVGPLRLTGQLQAQNLAPTRLDQGGLPLTHLETRLDWQTGALHLEALRLEAGPGQQASGHADWDGRQARAALTLGGIDLANWHHALKPTRLSGPMELEAGAAQQTLRARLQDPRFVAELALAHQAGRLTLRQARLTASQGGQLALSGDLRLGEPHDFQAQGRLEGFNPAAFARAPQASLSGQLNARGRLKPQAAGELELTLADSQLWAQGRPQPLSGHATLRLEGERLQQAQVLFDLAGNRLSAQGSLGHPGDRLQLAVDAPALARLGGGLGGHLRGQGQLAGPWREPAISLDLQAAELTLPGGHRLAAASVRGTLAPGAQGALDLQLRMQGYHHQGTDVQQASLSATGNRARHTIALESHFGAGNRLQATAQGGLDPAGWSGTLARLVVDGRLPLALQAPAPLQVAPARVALGPAHLAGPQAELQLVETLWTPKSIRSRGNLARLQPLPADPAASRLGVAPLRLAGDWDIRLDDSANGRVSLRRLDGDLVLGSEGGVAAGLSSLQLALTADAGRLRAQGNAAGSRIGSLELEASAQLTRRAEGWGLQAQAPVSGRLRLDTPDLAWLAPLAGANWRSGGRLQGEARLTGSVASPRLSGHLEGSALRLAALDQGLELEQGRLQVKLEGDLVRLEALEFASPMRVRPAERRAIPEPDGNPAPPLQASGEIRLSDQNGRFRIQAHNLLVLQLRERWLMATADATLLTGTGGLRLSGHISADGGYFEMPGGNLPRLGDDVVVLGQEARRANGLPVAVDVTANLGNHLHFEGQGLETRLTGQIRLRSDGRAPLRATGSIRTRGGVFDAYGQKLAIERGILNFQGPLDNPGLNVRALRTGLAVEAGVAIGGSVANPKVKLVSEPEVPDNEKLSWIVLGRGPDQAGGGDSAVLLAAATSILGGPGSSGGLTRQLAQSLGLDDVSLRAGDLASSDNRSPVHTVAGSTSSGGTVSGQVVSLGKRLSSAAYLSYEQSLSGVASIVKLTYALNRRVSVVARAGTDNALDLVLTFVFK